MRFHSIPFICIALGGMLTLTPSCSSESSSSPTSDSEHSSTAKDVAVQSPEEYSDLKMFELSGSVQQCQTTTYYSVALNDDNSLKVDTAATASRTVSTEFDRQGNYLTSKDELVKRDSKGRLIYWRDRRANAQGVHPGVLRDTLRYTHVNDNVLETDGMGEFSVTVYDNAGRVVGQMSDPRVGDSQTSAFNVYRLEDSHGNWTERLTIWTTKTPGRKPHVSYTVDRRTITYYPDASER